MNYYYEIADCVTTEFGDHKYWVQHNVSCNTYTTAFNYKAMQYSTRVWAEKNGSVKFVKHRFADLYDTHGYVTDIEEFFMIKLRAQALR